MNKKKLMSQIFILTIFTMNIAILAIPMQDEEFNHSDHLLLSFLRELGFDHTEPKEYHLVPVLSNSTLGEKSHD